jgi:AcrR family transcriptional regulator
MNSVLPTSAPAIGAAPEPYHKGNVPARLLEVAERILETETVEDITARRLCREIGVTSANFYNHYPSLDYLLLEIAAKGFAARSRMMRKLLKSNPSREDAMKNCAIKTVELSLKHPQLFRIMFGYFKDPAQNPNYVNKADESLAVLTHIVYGEDIFRPDDIAWSHENCQKAYTFFSFIYGLAMAMSTNMISNPYGTRKAIFALVEDLTDSFLQGVG